MDFIKFLLSFFKKEEKPKVIISTGGGGGGGGGPGGGAGGHGGSVTYSTPQSRTKFTLILVLIMALIGLVWFGLAIVRLENYHYAVQVGFCDEYSGVKKLAQKDQCLNKVQTRTNSLYHLLYGLKILK